MPPVGAWLRGSICLDLCRFRLAIINSGTKCPRPFCRGAHAQDSLQPLSHPASAAHFRDGRRFNGWPEVSEARLLRCAPRRSRNGGTFSNSTIFWPILFWAKSEQFCGYPCRSACVVPIHLQLVCIPGPCCTFHFLELVASVLGGVHGIAELHYPAPIRSLSLLWTTCLSYPSFATVNIYPVCRNPSLGLVARARRWMIQILAAE